MVYHVVFHMASCSMEIHMVNHVVGKRCNTQPVSTQTLVWATDIYQISVFSEETSPPYQ